MGSLSLLQGIFPTQESNQGSPALQADSLPTELWGEPPSTPTILRLREWSLQRCCGRKWQTFWEGLTGSGGPQPLPSPGSLRVIRCSISTSGQSVEGPGGITEPTWYFGKIILGKAETWNARWCECGVDISEKTEELLSSHSPVLGMQPPGHLSAGLRTNCSLFPLGFMPNPNPTLDQPVTRTHQCESVSPGDDLPLGRKNRLSVCRGTDWLSWALAGTRHSSPRRALESARRRCPLASRAQRPLRWELSPQASGEETRTQRLKVLLHVEAQLLPSGVEQSRYASGLASISPQRPVSLRHRGVYTWQSHVFSLLLLVATTHSKLLQGWLESPYTSGPLLFLSLLKNYLFTWLHWAFRIFLWYSESSLHHAGSFAEAHGPSSCGEWAQ